MSCAFARRRIVASLLYACIATSVSSAQVVKVSDFSSVGRSVQRSTIGEFDSRVYFGVAIDDTTQRELWRFDGSSLQRMDQQFFGDTDISINEFIEFKGDMYFSADTGQNGSELYRFDGQNISLAADIEPGGASSFPVGLTIFDDNLYFSAKNGESYNNLWKFDGTSATHVASFDDPEASVVTGLGFRGDFYFGADDGERGMELWKLDGDTISHVADIAQGSVGSFPRDFSVAGDQLYFKATTVEQGQEVWKFDGNDVSILHDVNPGPKSSDPQRISEVDGELMFSAISYGKRSLYRYDGNQAKPVVKGGGPIEIGGETFTIRGRRENGVEENDIYTLDGDLFRTTVASAGPFSSLDDELVFTCACDERELYMLASDGDADSDGSVGIADFLALANNFGKKGEWNGGDFDRSGDVTMDDFLLQAPNFGKNPPIAKALNIPEPAAANLFAFAVLIVAAVRRRRTV